MLIPRIIGFLILKAQQRNFQVNFPPIKLPLTFFMVSTLVALAFSPEPGIGLPPINKFWLFAVIPLICSLFTEGRGLQGLSFSLCSRAACGFTIYLPITSFSP